MVVETKITKTIYGFHTIPHRLFNLLSIKNEEKVFFSVFLSLAIAYNDETSVTKFSKHVFLQISCLLWIITSKMGLHDFFNHESN
jgi:hypothetical protein